MDRIGPYVLGAELGRGAFGVVYLAHHHERPDVPLALKVVPGRGDADRLLLEPALLSRLNHPCIVRLEDYFLHEDNLALALEFIAGDDLKTCVERGEVFDQAQVRDLLVQLASALAQAHAANIIHRDIKLSNILVDRTGGRLRFVLTDFGIGQQAEGIQVRKHTGGTYWFMAPEQLRGRPCPQSDLWALGVVAYRLLTGKMPFQGDTVHDLSSQIFYTTPEPPSRCSARPVDAQLEAAVFRLLEKSLSERTASATELLRDLGHSGKVDALLSPDRRPDRAGGRSLDRQLRSKVARYQTLAVVFGLLYMVQGGLGSGVLLLIALTIFLLVQRRPRGNRLTDIPALLASLVLMAGSTMLARSGKDLTWGWVWVRLLLWLKSQRSPLLVELPFSLVFGWLHFVTVSFGGFLLALLLAALTAHYLAELRSRQRARALRQGALEGGGDPRVYLKTMRRFLDYRFEDVGYHLKLVEALLARGRAKEAAVEARILLRQDPYNFNGNLLLANAYFALGLFRACAAVCADYLAVAGYCFEFSELRQQCIRREAQA
jgi:serine/threonine-protein kinase